MEVDFLQSSSWYTFTRASLKEGIGYMVYINHLWRPITAIWWFRVPALLNMSPEHINSYECYRAICPVII